ncbi:MAG: helix-hairpin-helix domain-containing protein [Flavobacteriales bacterium]|nr:helix-hairpin-helix domain-containing protein [Flavobacteriales bacterium]
MGRAWLRVLAMHRAERRGMLLLLLLLVLSMTWALWQQFRPLAPVELEALKSELAAFRSQQAAYEARADDAQSDSSPLIVLPEGPFDPNDLGEEQWMQLGLNEREAKGVIRYRDAAGGFHYLEDMENVRSIGKERFQAWLPYIRLPKRPVREVRTSGKGSMAARREERPRVSADGPDTTGKPLLVELNSTDSATLVAVPGIGPSFSKGILAYRELLGGYTSFDQLHEVYVLRDHPEAIERFLHHLRLDTARVRSIPINSCTADRLAAHPYVRWKQAKALVAYRDQHGPFHTLDELSGCVLMDTITLRKLAPYLTLE